MRIQLPTRLCFLAVFLTVVPYTPQHFMALAKGQPAVSDKISLLRRLTRSFPLDRLFFTAQKDLVSLLQGSNRYAEALQLYEDPLPPTSSASPLDLQFLDLLLKTGRYSDVLRLATFSSAPLRDLQRDEKSLELRIQALLAMGRYQRAREAVDQWLGMYAREGLEGGRFADEVYSIQCLRRHLRTLERTQGPIGKALFTASVPDSLNHWSHRRDVPLVYFKLLPAGPVAQRIENEPPGHSHTPAFFQRLTAALNRGFEKISGHSFTLKGAEVHTLYIKQEDLGPQTAHASILTARVFVHTIPPLYRLAGNAFVVLIDYRGTPEESAAYMGDGLIHLPADKLRPMTLMHEILHGLGATHQDWNSLIQQGYKFNPRDRGLMSFEKGELCDFGLEEKNSALLGWPRTESRHFNQATAANAWLEEDPSLTPSSN